MMTRARSLMLLLAAAVIYGGMFPVNRMAAEAGWPPVAFAMVPALLGGLAMLLGCAAAGSLPSLGRTALFADLVIGGLVIGLPIAILVTAAQHLDASTLTLVLCLSPVLTLLIGIATGSEKFDYRVLAGMGIGLAGIALIARPQSGILGEGGLRWFLLALVAPAMFATANNCAAWLRPPAASAMAMATGTLLGGALVAAVTGLAMGADLWPGAMGWEQLLPLLLSVLINTVFFWLFFVIVGAIGPARFSLFNYLAVGAGIVWSMAIFGEKPAPVFWLAAVLMLAGMHVALRPGKSRSELEV